MKTKNTITRISTMIESKKPFAIMEIYSGLPSQLDGVEYDYELLTLCDGKIKYCKLTDSELLDLKRNSKNLRVAKNTANGRVLEFNNFGNIVKTLKKILKKELNTSSAVKINNALNIQIDELEELD